VGERFSHDIKWGRVTGSEIFFFIGQSDRIFHLPKGTLGSVRKHIEYKQCECNVHVRYRACYRLLFRLGPHILIDSF
jgi:hypothetical protein